MRMFRLLAVLIVVAWGTCQLASAETSDPKATLKYWNAVVGPSSSRCGLLKGLEGMPNPSPQGSSEIWRQLASHLNERREELAALSMLGVDPVAVEYGVLRQKTIGEVGMFIWDLSSFSDECAEASSGGATGMRFLLALMSHANDEDDVLLNALKQGVADTASVAHDLQQRANLIAQKKATIERLLVDMQQKEVEARAKLTQKYNVDFVSSSANPPKFSELPENGRIDARMLQKHLLGQSVDLASGRWTFEEGEFQSIQVVKAQGCGDAQRYELEVLVRGIRSGNQHILRVYMLYHREQESLVLRAVSAQDVQ